MQLFISSTLLCLNTRRKLITINVHLLDLFVLLRKCLTPIRGGRGGWPQEQRWKIYSRHMEMSFINHSKSTLNCKIFESPAKSFPVITTAVARGPPLKYYEHCGRYVSRKKKKERDPEDVRGNRGENYSELRFFRRSKTDIPSTIPNQFDR